MFKKGDYVKIKEGTLLETGEEVNNWAGKIHEVYLKEKTCLIELDAQTLNSLDEFYLSDCIEMGEEPFEYIFEFKELELTERRDTDLEMMEALANLTSRMSDLEENDEEEAHEEQKEHWIGEFIQSPYYEDQTDYQMENSGFIIDSFMSFMYNYEYINPQDWRSENVKEVCLNLVPRKITAESEFFENYGQVLQQFMKFLGSKQYIKRAKELESTIEQIKRKIAKQASDPSNWGMAKSMMMEAQYSGVDVTDEAELKEYIFRRNNEFLKEENQGRIIPLRPNPFKNIGRNQKITVKYTDGKILKNIKFKKVEQDLIDGKCELIEK